MNSTIIIFVKNNIPGQVKTRIALEKDEKIASEVYEELIQLTRNTCDKFPCFKYVYFSSFIPDHSDWSPEEYSFKLQTGEDLGERMDRAISEELEHGEKVVLIGSDCPYLQKEHIEKAFDALNTFDVVLGPSTDGGYYLIGMKKSHSFLFKNIAWSKATVLKKSIEKIIEKGLSYSLLDPLSDIDYWKDWENYISTSP
jgi:rSAM/selenodomain-associated transferase 1